MKYRSEIDGLRALAVVPVILFHAGFDWFSGGFVGVDVFFVISGYLITTILIEELENRNFSIVNFYERRARRILPALFFVMLVCIPFAWQWMLPLQMQEFSQSLIAVSLFASNFLFWQQSGYFDTAAEEKPLLHTWSLAVEEQYYVFFPIFLLLAWRFGRHSVFWLVVLMTVGSLALSEWAWRNMSNANFFLAPTRAWELFAGSIAAFIVQRRGVLKSDLLAMTGLVAIVLSIFAYDKNTPFPSAYALLPVGGVVLLVLYGEKTTIAAKILSNRIAVGIGLISYSAYLWHQPLFAFARIRSVDHPSVELMAGLSIASLFLAYFSWRFVETPFRSKSNKAMSRAKIFIFSLLGMLFFITVGAVGHVTEGFIKRDKFASIQEINTVAEQSGSGFKYCAENAISIEGLKGYICKIGDLEAPVSGVLWGDSYAASALYGVNKHLKTRGVSYYAILGDGCPPLPGISRARNEYDCTYDRQQDVVDWFNKQDELVDLIWVGRFKLLAGKNISDGYSIDGNLPSLASVESKLTSTISDLLENNKRVVFVIEGPNFERHIPSYLSKVNLFDLNLDDSIINTNIESQRDIIGLSKEFFEKIPGINYVDSINVFCGNNVCSAIMDDGELLVVDNGHISHLASERLAEEIFTKLSLEP